MPPDPVDRLNAALEGRYRIERELGEGGMATVYLADDLRHERKVALKVLKPELAATMGPDRFLKEIRVTANLQHPHILPLHDSGEADGFLYYVMPYVEGESLRERLVREGELPVGEAVKILKEVTDALAAAHAMGIVHRDIKPDNVMLSGRHAMMTDFGVAKALSESADRHQLTTQGVSLGTPAYMAPEQAAANEYIDHRADIYALGALGYELLAGRPPFTGTSPQAVLSAHVIETPRAVTELRSTVPADLGAVMMRCLEKKAADRWQSAEELLAQLEGFVTPATGLTPTRVTPTTARPGAGRALKPLVVGTVVVVLVAVSSLIVRRDAQPPDPVTAAEANAVAVMPFSVRGVGVDDWGEGMVHTLTPTIDAVAGLRAISGRTVLARWRDEVGDSEPDLSTTLDVARAVGARYALVGSVVSTAQDVRIDFDVLELSTGESIAVRRLDGASDGLLELSDRVAAETVRALLEHLGQIPSVVLERLTDSPEALLAYVEGEAAFSRYRLVEAREAFLRAVEHDSAFAMAHFRLYNVGQWGVTAGSTSGHRELFEQHVDRLSPRYQLLARLPSDGPGDYVGRLREGVQRYPDEAAMWYQLGEELIHASEGLATVDELESAFAEAVRLEPNRASFYNHAVGIATRERRDPAHARELVRRFAEIGEAEGPYRPDFDPRVGPFALDLLYGSDSVRDTAYAALDTLPSDFLRAVGTYVNAPTFGDVLERVALAGFSRAGGASPNDSRAGFARLLIVLYAQWRGQMSAALRYIGAADLSVGRNSQLYYLHGIGLPVPDSLLVEAHGAEWIDSTSSTAIVFYAGAFAVDDGRWEDHARALRILAGGPGTEPARLARALEGYGALRRGDTDDAVRLLESSHNGTTIVLWWLGEAYADAGRWAEAERVFGSSTWAEAFSPFTLEPLAQRRLGAVYEAQGRIDEALEAYDYFLEQWADADPELQPLLSETQARVEAIR